MLRTLLRSRLDRGLTAARGAWAESARKGTVEAGFVSADALPDDTNGPGFDEALLAQWRTIALTFQATNPPNLGA